MHASLKPLVEIAFFNNALFKHATGDISEQEADTTADEHVTSYRWILAHIVTGRFVLAGLCGVKEDLPWNGIYMDAVQSSDSPNIAEISKEFERITPLLLRSMAVLDAKALSTAPATPFPTAEKTTLAALAFLLQHESYHLGQLSYVRRLLGKDGLVDRLLSS